MHFSRRDSSHLNNANFSAVSEDSLEIDSIVVRGESSRALIILSQHDVCSLKRASVCA